MPLRIDTPFLRKRLLRAAVVLAVGLFAFRYLPQALPADQTLVFEAPSGRRFVDLSVTYRDEDGAHQRGTKLHPTQPSSTLEHLVRMPSGEYQLELQATITGIGTGERQRIVKQRRLVLDGNTTRIFVDGPPSAPGD